MSSSDSQFSDDRVVVSSAEADEGGGQHVGSAIRCPAGVVPPWLGSASGKPLGGDMVGYLRALAVVIDDGWRAALRGEGGCAFRLGEASHGVHRALIAMEGYVSDVESGPR